MHLNNPHFQRKYRHIIVLKQIIREGNRFAVDILASVMPSISQIMESTGLLFGAIQVRCNLLVFLVAPGQSLVWYNKKKKH